MLTALRSSPALLNRVLPVLYFDLNLLIPDILNSIKLIFISNGCQGIRICTLFFEKKSEVWEKIVLEQVRFRTNFFALFSSRHFENRHFCGLLAALYTIKINTFR